MAKLDDIDSIKALIEIYNAENALSDVFHWNSVLAKKFDPEGTFYTGICYEFGYGVAPNASEALYYYKKALDRGYHEAYSRLGDIYLNGELGERIDEQRAFDLYFRGALIDDPYSCYCLAFCYDYYKGTTPNPSQAIYYYEKFLRFKNLDERFEKTIDEASDRLHYLKALQGINGD